jgi:hypothetical protein
MLVEDIAALMNMNILFRLTGVCLHQCSIARRTAYGDPVETEVPNGIPSVNIVQLRFQ